MQWSTKFKKNVFTELLPFSICVYDFSIIWKVILENQKVIYVFLVTIDNQCRVKDAITYVGQNVLQLRCLAILKAVYSIL